MDERTRQAREALAAEIARRSKAAPEPEDEQRLVTGEGEGNPNSKRTLEKLRGLTRTMTAQLAEERKKYLVSINTLATELADLQRETIEAREARVVELEARVVELEAEVLMGRDGLPEAKEPAPIPGGS